MEVIELYPDQLEAKDKIIELFKNPKVISFTLQGSAGTGKTTLVKSVINEIKKYNRNIVLATPTHKAAQVLSDKTGLKVCTIHSILNLSPGVTLDNFDISNPIFIPRKEPNIIKKTCFFIDEASMINRSLRKRLEQVAEASYSQICFIGDNCQLPPVKEDVSSIFTTIKNQVHLTTIKRSNKENILNLWEWVRENINNPQLNLSDFKSINSDVEFIEYSDVPNIYNQNSKYIAYTNKRISQINSRLHQLYLGLDEIDNNFYVGDIIQPYKTGSISNNSVAYINSEELIINNIIPNYLMPLKNIFTTDDYKYGLSSKIEEFKTTLLKTTNTLGKNVNLCVIDEESYYDLLTIYNLYYKRAKEVRDKNISSKLWSDLLDLTSTILAKENIVHLDYENIVYFKTLDYAYALTTHRSQGSTYKEVIVDTQDIKTMRSHSNRCIYTALTRASDKIYIL